MEVLETIPLNDAASVLHAAFPDSDSGWRRRIFSPDYLIDRSRALGGRVDTIFVRNWENREDRELVEILLGNFPVSGRDVIVITDLCLGASPPGVSKVSGAFVATGEHLPDFIEQYRSKLVNHFVDGDVIVFPSRDSTLRIFHHEGAVFRVDLAGAQEWKGGAAEAANILERALHGE